MKKILAFLLAALFAVTLTGCGGTPSGTDETAVPTTEETTLPKEFTLFVKTEGAGCIAYAENGTPVFNEKFPSLSAEIYASGPSTYALAAKPNEGSKFVKWTKDGEDYAEQAQITVDVDRETVYVAVFEPVEE